MHIVPGIMQLFQDTYAKKCESRRIKYIPLPISAGTPFYLTTVLYSTLT